MTNKDIIGKEGYYWFKPDKAEKELKFLLHDEEPWTLVEYCTYSSHAGNECHSVDFIEYACGYEGEVERVDLNQCIGEFIPIERPKDISK